MNKTIEALKLAEEALQHYRIKWAGEDTTPAHTRKALAAIREALAEPKCSDHPDAPHGFDRNGSHNAGRYVCDCEGWIPPEPVKQEPVACQDSDDRRLLREIFMLCEATEEIEATNDFMRGRVFEAKGIRRGIGTWYQDTFCGRSYMGEPVIPATPVQPVKQEPVAYVTGYYGGRCVVEPLNRASVLPNNLALYAEPVQPTKQEPVAWHHPECEGECIACLIERCVKDSYGKQGVDYMLRHMNAAPIQPVKQEPLCEDEGCPHRGTPHICIEKPVKQEPVAWMQIGVGSNKGTTMFVTRLPNWHREDEWQFEPLYTSPIQPVNQEPVQKPAAWFHKIGCRANAFGECDMGCQPPVDAKAIREAARAELMAELNKTWGNKHWTAYEEAIRAEALEEAAKVCETRYLNQLLGSPDFTDESIECAEAIRRLK